MQGGWVWVNFVFNAKVIATEKTLQRHDGRKVKFEIDQIGSRSAS